MLTRHSSRRNRLDKAVLNQRLEGAVSYDRIAGYFRSSLFEVAGEAINGLVAQSVEQRTENPCVGGSIPPQATSYPNVFVESACQHAMQISENGLDLSSDTNIGSVGRLHSVRRRPSSRS